MKSASLSRRVGPESAEARPGGQNCPAPGDVIIARDAVNSTPWHTVREFPRTAQLLCVSREAALKLAKSFAQRQRVEIWEAEGATYSRIDPRG